MNSNKTLSIAYIVDAWFPSNNNQGVVGGGQVHVRELTRQLQHDYGVEIRLYYPQRLHLLFRLFWSLLIPFKIWNDHRRQNFNLIHSHGFNSGLAGKLAGLLVNKPVVHTVHGSPLLDLGQHNIKTWLERLLLTKIKYDAQISVGQKFRKHPNVNQPVIIPNGVAIAAFEAVSIAKNSQPTIIWVGRKEEPLKMYQQFEQLTASLRKQLPHLEVIIAHGQLAGKELIKAYKRSHIFLLNSIAEGQPITLLEAWASQLPVVVTNVGDNQRMIDTSNGGLLVEPGDLKALEQACLKLLQDPKLQKDMGEAGYDYVCKHHDWKYIAKHTWGVYQSLIKKQGK